MGLLYVDGVPYHDEDAELIERAERRSRLSRHHPIVTDGEAYDGVFDDGTRSVGFVMSDRQAAKDAAYWARVKASGMTELEYLCARHRERTLSDEVREAARKRRDSSEQ